MTKLKMIIKNDMLINEHWNTYRLNSYLILNNVWKKNKHYNTHRRTQKVKVNYDSYSSRVKLYQSHVQSKDLTTWSIFQICNTVTLILKESLHRQKCNDCSPELNMDISLKFWKRGFMKILMLFMTCIQWNCKLAK